MPKPLKNTRRYKKRKTTKGGCGCYQKGGYSLKKLSIRKSLRKSLGKKSKKPIVMKGGFLGGVSNTSLNFGTYSGAVTAAGVIGGTPSSGYDPHIAASSTVSGNNEYSHPIV